jgi:hypothetical protein
MRHPGPLVLLAILLTAAIVSASPSDAATEYHSITWDAEYEYKGIYISTNAPDLGRVPDGFDMTFTISSDEYDVGQMGIFLYGPDDHVIPIGESGDGYIVRVNSDIRIILNNFVSLPQAGTEPDPVPDDPVVPSDTVSPDGETYVQDRPSDTYVGILLAFSVMVSSAVLIYGIYTAYASGGISNFKLR